MKCFRLLVKVEEAQIILKKWQSELNETDTKDEDSRQEKRDSETPAEAPRKKTLCKTINTASRISTTEVNCLKRVTNTTCLHCLR